MFKQCLKQCCNVMFTCLVVVLYYIHEDLILQYLYIVSENTLVMCDTEMFIFLYDLIPELFVIKKIICNFVRKSSQCYTCDVKEKQKEHVERFIVIIMAIVMNNSSNIRNGNDRFMKFYTLFTTMFCSITHYFSIVHYTALLNSFSQSISVFFVFYCLYAYHGNKGYHYF